MSGAILPSHNRSHDLHGGNLPTIHLFYLEQEGHTIPVFLNRRAAARYRVLASIIPGHERFSWNVILVF